jgi:hypothetical protein
MVVFPGLNPTMTNLCLDAAGEIAAIDAFATDAVKRPL